MNASGRDSDLGQASDRDRMRDRQCDTDRARERERLNNSDARRLLGASILFRGEDRGRDSRDRNDINYERDRNTNSQRSRDSDQRGRGREHHVNEPNKQMLNNRDATMLNNRDELFKGRGGVGRQTDGGNYREADRGRKRERCNDRDERYNESDREYQTFHNSDRRARGHQYPIASNPSVYLMLLTRKGDWVGVIHMHLRTSCMTVK